MRYFIFLCLLLFFSAISVPAYAQSAVPSPQCLGSCPTIAPSSINPSSVFPSGTVSVAPTSTSTISTTQPNPSSAPTTVITNPSPSAAPCSTSESSVSSQSTGGSVSAMSRHHHGKWHKSGRMGFLQQLIEWLIQLLQRLGITIPGLPCGTTTSPSGTPSTAPSSTPSSGAGGTLSQTPSSAPGGNPTPTIFGTTPAPTSAATPTGSATGPLAQWKTALTNRATTGATWVAIGDSITEGQGSSTVAGRWANQTLTALRGKYSVSGVTGGFGYIPAFYGTYGPDSQWSTDPTLSGSASENVAKDDGNDGQSFGNDAGLGMLTVTLGSGGSETFKVNGSSIDILYNYGSGTFSYKVDSGTATNVSTSGGSGATGSKHVAFSSAGSHTVTISGVSGSVILEGIMTYNGDETKGIRQYVGAQSGTTSGDFAAQAQNMAAIVANVKADLVTIEIGGNDYNRSSGTPTQTTANIKALVSDIRSASTGHEPSIVIVAVYPISGGADAQGFTYSDYVSAMKSVTTADTSLGYLDFSALGATAGQPSQYLSSTDDLHPSDAGQAKLATIVASYLEN